MKRSIGLDLGSRRTKGVVLEQGKILERAIFNSWALEKNQVVEWVNSWKIATIGSTGYSRRLAELEFGARVITEIKAFALGASLLYPEARTIIDVGGQDAKAIRIDDNGMATDFEMNDRCAAGTGKFFELAAKTLGLSLENMPESALRADTQTSITSTCAVFAESEIIGKLADGIAPPDIARGIFRSVAERLFAMTQRIGHQPPVILVGGGASSCLAYELSMLLNTSVLIPPDGSFFGAAGTALHAGKEPGKEPERGSRKE